MGLAMPVLQRMGGSRDIACAVYAEPIKRCHLQGVGSFSIQKEAADPAGSFVLTLNNVVVGSAIQIEAQDGSAVLHNSVAAGASVVISLSAYAPGSPLNNLRIKVRKGSASPFFQPYETLATALVGAQAIFVSQTPDE